MMRVIGVIEPVKNLDPRGGGSGRGHERRKEQGHQQESRLHVALPEPGRRSRAAQFFKETRGRDEYLCS